LQALTVAMLVLLLAVVALAAWNDTRLREQPATDTAERQPDEPEQQEPPPQPDDGDAGGDDQPGSSIGRTASRIRDLLEREADEATSRAVEELEKELEEALKQRAEGDDDGVVDRIQRLRDRIQKLDEKDEIGDGLADRMRDLIDGTRLFES
jgi:cytochrome c-type biogenesis protein CcmH/NrfG